jgi:small subunit ribosomal protein S2
MSQKNTTKQFKPREGASYIANKTFVDVKQTMSLFSKKPQIGQVYELTITSIINKLENNKNSSEQKEFLGIGDFSEGYKILVPNTELGDKVKVKIIKSPKVFFAEVKKSNFAFAQIVELLNKAQKRPPFTVGDITKVKVTSIKEEADGLDVIMATPLLNDQNILEPYYFIISQKRASTSKSSLQRTVIGDILDICITQIKPHYGFAKIIGNSTNVLHDSRPAAASQEVLIQKLRKVGHIGKKLNIVLPQTAKKAGNLICLQLQNRKTSSFLEQKSIFFIKLGLGAKLGDKVRIKICKSAHNTFFAKVIKKDPISNEQKQHKIKQNMEQMLKSGMHFGEKAVKCNAKMRDFVWIRKKGRNKNRPYLKKGRHFLNLLKTRQCLNKALKQLIKYAVKGRTFLFVGTKKPATSLVSRAALFSQRSFFVNTRWLGGMLTNWKTILKSVSKIRPILKEKQRIIHIILTKRHTIKLRLMKKILASMTYIQKGRQFLQTILEGPQFIQKNQVLALKRKELIQKGQLLLKKRQQLVEKRKHLLESTGIIKSTLKEDNLPRQVQSALKIVQKYETLLTILTSQKHKLRELHSLLLLSCEIQKLKKNALTLTGPTYIFQKSQICKEKNLLSGPTPSKEILSKIIKAVQLLSSTTQWNTDKTETKYRLIALSKVLNKFSTFSSYIKVSIKRVYENILEILKKLKMLKEALIQIKKELTNNTSLLKNYIKELRTIKNKLNSEQKIIKLLKSKIKRASAEKRFIAFLPKLRYLPTATSDASRSVQILMEKFVDTKLKQPAATLMENIYNTKLRTNSKKLSAARRKKWQRLEKYFGGVANMLKMNKNKISKNIAIIVGQQEEMNAVRECQKLGIQMFHLVDSNCNPTLANHYVPTNDDSRNSIKYVLTKFLKHIRIGQKLRIKIKQKRSFL